MLVSVVVTEALPMSTVIVLVWAFVVVMVVEYVPDDVVVPAAPAKVSPEPLLDSVTLALGTALPYAS